MKNNIISRVETAISTNSLIYWLSKIPVIKKKISVRFYSEEKYKTWFRGATHIFNAILFILINTAYPILLLGLTGLIQDVLPFDQPIIYLILWTTLLISANIHSLVYEDSPTKWLLINIFRTNPNATFLLAYNKRLMNRFIYSFFAACAVYLIQGSFFHIVWTFILPTAILPISNYLVYTITISKQHLLTWKQWLTLSLMYYLIPILMFIFNSYLFIVLPLFSIALIISAILCHKKVIAFNQFDSINVLMKSTMKLSSDVEQSVLELSKKELRIDENFDTKRSKAFLEKLHGYKLLNIAFFDRHRRMWLKPLMNSIKAVLGFGLILILGLSILRMVSIVDFRNVIRDADNILTVSQNILIMGLYGINASRKITKACFLNCDYSLLHYAFYKSSDTIWKQYLVRLSILIVINIVPVLIFALVMFIVSIFGFINFFTMTMLNVLSNLLMFSVFFSTIYVFLYYLLQPFDKDMNTNSPLYSFITMAVYYLALYSNHITSLSYSGLLILGVVILFFIGSTLTIRLVGHKTFKLHEK